MYKVEIITVVGSFIADTPDTIKSDIDALDAIGDAIVEPKGGLQLEDGSLLRIFDSKQILGIRAFSDNSVTSAADNETAEGIANVIVTPWDSPAGFICPWCSRVTYVGKQYEAVIYTTQDSEGRAYFLLYTIDGIAARDMISDEGQKKFIQAWLVQCQGGVQKEYTLVLPHGTISDKEEAEAYLKDFIRENQGTYKPKEKTGKAYTGWNEDRGLK